MGREIRRVPKDWVHPQMVSKYYGSEGQMVDRPMYEQTYESAMDEWIRNYQLWRIGQHPDQLDGSAKDCKTFQQWEGTPPDAEYYNTFYDPNDPAVATHYQIYQNVSEGSPVSPVFETLEEMETWLISQGHSEKAAKGFCRTGYAPAMIMGPGFIKSGIDTHDLPGKL
jgi:hypothetical protein